MRRQFIYYFIWRLCAQQIFFTELDFNGCSSIILRGRTQNNGRQVAVWVRLQINKLLLLLYTRYAWCVGALHPWKRCAIIHHLDQCAEVLMFWICFWCVFYDDWSLKSTILLIDIADLQRTRTRHSYIARSAFGIHVCVCIRACEIDRKRKRVETHNNKKISHPAAEWEAQKHGHYVENRTYIFVRGGELEEHGSF